MKMNNVNQSLNLDESMKARRNLALEHLRNRHMCKCTHDYKVCMNIKIFS